MGKLINDAKEFLKEDARSHDEARHREHANRNAEVAKTHQTLGNLAMNAGKKVEAESHKKLVKHYSEIAFHHHQIADMYR